jgi:hypothetical protein
MSNIFTNITDGRHGRKSRMRSSGSTEIGVEAWLLDVPHTNGNINDEDIYIHPFLSKHFYYTVKSNMTIPNHVSNNICSLFYNIFNLRNLRNKTQDNLWGRYAGSNSS